MCLIGINSSIAVCRHLHMRVSTALLLYPESMLLTYVSKLIFILNCCSIRNLASPHLETVGSF